MPSCGRAFIREKKKLLKEYEAYKYADQMGKQWVRVIKDTEIARSEYRKNRTLENADKLLATICPVGRKGIDYAAMEG